MADSPRQAVLTLIGRYAENQELDAGMAEIVAWHQASHSILVINAKDASVDVLDAGMLASAALDSPLSASSLSRRGRIQVGRDVSIAAGSVNSVAVRGSLMAVAVEHDDKQADGVIAFYTLDGGGKAAFQKQVAAGPLPDSVAFTPDGATLLVANEGEPSDDYARDPEGSVTLIAVRGGVAADTGTRVSFADFNAGGGRADELGDGVRISHPKASVAQDLEPEFVAASADNTTAYVSLQENNALAVVDIAGRQVRRLIGFGAKDHGVAGNGLDASNKDDAINIRTVDGLSGLYMPDTIAAFVHDGTNYVLTANEGDAREYFFDAGEAACSAAGGMDWDEDDGCLAWSDEKRVRKLELDATVFPDAKSLQKKKNLGRVPSASGMPAAASRCSIPATISNASPPRRSAPPVSTPPTTKMASTTAPTTKARNQKPWPSVRLAAGATLSSVWSAPAASWFTTSPGRRQRRSCNTSPTATTRWTSKTIFRRLATWRRRA